VRRNKWNIYPLIDIADCQIWESNAKPRNYLVTASYTKKARHRRIFTKLTEVPVPLNKALDQFTSFFRKKTGFSWDERIEKAGTMGLDYFDYQLPVS